MTETHVVFRARGARLEEPPVPKGSWSPVLPEREDKLRKPSFHRGLFLAGSAKILRGEAGLRSRGLWASSGVHGDTGGHWL